jgi:FixJ family two-component response regulator
MEVLIIDDSLEICESLSFLINGEGFEVKYFLSYQEGISYFTENKNPILFLDIHLENIRGTDILPYIKDVSPLTQVIMMTGESSVDLVIDSLKNKAIDFLNKPFSASFVKNSLKRAEEFYKIQKENNDYNQELENNIRFLNKIQNNVLFPILTTDNYSAYFLNTTQVSTPFYSIMETTDKTVLFFGIIDSAEVTAGFTALFTLSAFKEIFPYKFSAKDIIKTLNNEIYSKINIHSILANCIYINNRTLFYSKLGLQSFFIINLLTSEIESFEQRNPAIMGVIPDIEFQENTVLLNEDDIIFILDAKYIELEKISKIISEIVDISEKSFDNFKVNIRLRLENELEDFSFLLYQV